jgi:hypothetical protein
VTTKILAGGGLLTNAGTVLADATLAGGGVILGKAGSVANAGLISGFYGVEFTGAAGAVGDNGAILADLALVTAAAAMTASPHAPTVATRRPPPRRFSSAADLDRTRVPMRHPRWAERGKHT